MKITKIIAVGVLCAWSIGVTAFATSINKTQATIKHPRLLLPDDSGCDDGDADDSSE